MKKEGRIKGGLETTTTTKSKDKILVAYFTIIKRNKFRFQGNFNDPFKK